VFAPSSQGGPFRQGEILSDVVQVRLLVESLTADQDAELEFEEETHPFVVVLTQDCDLDWDFTSRASETDENKRQNKLVPNILLGELFPESVIRPRIGRNLDRVKSKQEFRYHYIPAVPLECDLAGEGIEPLIVDFKRVLTVPCEEIYHRLNFGIRRRTLIQGLHMQDLSNRFAHYASRVGLPEEGTRPTLVIPGSAPVGAKGEPGFLQRLARGLSFKSLKPPE